MWKMFNSLCSQNSGQSNISLNHSVFVSHPITTSENLQYIIRGIGRKRQEGRKKRRAEKRKGVASGSFFFVFFFVCFFFLFCFFLFVFFCLFFVSNGDRTEGFHRHHS